MKKLTKKTNMEKTAMMELLDMFQVQNPLRKQMLEKE
jgi:hypothetical protein